MRHVMCNCIFLGCLAACCVLACQRHSVFKCHAEMHLTVAELMCMTTYMATVESLVIVSCLSYRSICHMSDMVWCDMCQLWFDVTCVSYGLMCNVSVMVWCDMCRIWFDVTCVSYGLMWHVSVMVWCDMCQSWFDGSCVSYGLVCHVLVVVWCVMCQLRFDVSCIKMI